MPQKDWGSSQSRSGVIGLSKSVEEIAAATGEEWTKIEHSCIFLTHAQACVSLRNIRKKG